MGSMVKAKARSEPRLTKGPFSHKKQATKGLLAGVSSEQVD
jgi:hypothetical protein